MKSDSAVKVDFAFFTATRKCVGWVGKLNCNFIGLGLIRALENLPMGKYFRPSKCKLERANILMILRTDSLFFSKFQITNIDVFFSQIYFFFDCNLMQSTRFL